MSNEYMHLSCDTNKFWVATLKKRIDDSPSVTLRERVTNWQDSALYEVGLAINTKFAMLDQVVPRIDRQLRRLGEQINDEKQLDWCLGGGTYNVYRIRDKDVFFKTLVDLDSFLFESRSTYEIVGKFLREFFMQILGKSLSEDELKTVLTDSRIDTRWIDELRDKRILFFHQTAPWIAARVVSKEPLRFELVILKKNVRDFTNPDHYVDFERLREIYNGFRSSRDEIHRWVEEQIEEFESNEPG